MCLYVCCVYIYFFFGGGGWWIKLLFCFKSCFSHPRDYQEQMPTTSKHQVRDRSLSFGGNEAPSWMVPLSPSWPYEVVTQEPSQSIKGPLGGKEHNPGASHFLWKYLTGNSLCAGYIRFSYCKHWDALLRLKVKASNVDCWLGDSMTDYLDSDVGGELSDLYQMQQPWSKTHDETLQ